jgi:transposase
MEAEKPAGKRQRTKYDAAFRTEVVRRVTHDGQAVTRVALVVGMSEAVLGKWVRAARSQAARPAGSEHWNKKTSTCGPSWPVRKWSATFKKKR